jgi:glycosyltransferase involved in cell wall biosynthesis
MLELGIVIIGRNEGQRLKSCLLSVLSASQHVVYVDSGSSDGSVELASQLGAACVELDMQVPFTAARARNAGVDQLEKTAPEIEFVQFVDGDCEVVAGWLERAAEELKADPTAAVTCGRRRERFPDRSCYNLLCDLEWDTPVGEAAECGGDALVRMTAFRDVDGYNPLVIAGEDSEMSMRLRAKGWTIKRIAAEMTLHDAAILRFAQWWKRTVRSGHALAERAALHGSTPLRDCVSQRRSTLFWGGAVPLAGCALLVHSLLWSIPLIAGYLLLMYKIYRYRRRQGDLPRAARLYAAFTMLGKFPQMQGLLRYYFNRLRGRNSAIIEYKQAAKAPADQTAPLRTCA